MATSQNGWFVHTSSSALQSLDAITGRVRPGAVHQVFEHLCRRFHAEVEPITRGHSWGWAYRPIRGSSSGYSNHASGTAIDLNAPAHPLGRRGTFTSTQVAAIRRILADLDGAVRWGGDYQNRADEMHFEINTDAAHLARVAAKINAHQEEDMTPAEKKLLEQTAADVAWLRKRVASFIKNEVTRDKNENQRETRRHQELKRGLDQ